MTKDDIYDAVVACGSNYSRDNETTALLAQTNRINMAEKNIGISQQTLVSSTGDSIVKAKRAPQYIAGLASTLGALAAGMVLGWTSPAGPDGVELSKQYEIVISPDEFSWIGSLAPLGAGIICVPIGILTDIIGRKNSMLVLVIPFTIGWACIIFANSVIMFYVGRFITGLSGGAFCVTAPMYTAEIAESEIRGSLGSYFQLLLTIGILLSYCFSNMFILSIVSAIVPLIFFGVFFFMPETPIYHLKKGNEDEARMSLIRLRGVHYDIESELQMHRQTIEEVNRNNMSFMDAIKSKAALKGLIIAYGLMFFQQMSGVNAIIFYASRIFNAADKNFNPNHATIIVGAIQVISVFVSTLIVDRLGRRFLLLSSDIAMCVSTLILGIYFYLIHIGENIENITWLPLLSVSVFICLFSLGFGPIPWMMMGEIFSPEVKGIAASSACFFNWLLAFVVTKFYSTIEEAIEPYGTFFIFSAICGLGIFFVFFLIPETKGKTLDEIQRELNA